MSIASKLEYLDETKDYIKQCIQQKGVVIPDGTTFRQYGDKILEIETSSEVPPTPEKVLQEGVAIATGTDFDLLPSEGYDGFSKVKVSGDLNLRPENIVEGITIYGVTGTMKVQPEMDSTIPTYYQYYFNHARELYTGEYKNVMILESDEAIAIGFMLDGFLVKSFDDATTEFTASDWVYVAYNKKEDSWKSEPHIGETSGGNTFIKNIRYSDTYIYFGTRLLYPYIEEVGGEIKDSWGDIVVNKGLNYPIGSWKKLTVGTIDGVKYGSVEMEKVYEGEGGTSSTWLSKTLLNSPRPLDTKTEANLVFGGWAVTELREWLNGVFLASLPGEIRDGISGVDKYTRVCLDKDTNEWETDNLTNDRIWVPSYQEIFGLSENFEKNGVTYEGVDRQKTPLNSTEKKPWWLRSSSKNSISRLSTCVGISGKAQGCAATESAYISFGFCL